jgi:5'-3' exonuclease
MTVAGEGEFKIMNQLQTIALTQNDTVMVVSPDADMIQQMLLFADRCQI